MITRIVNADFEPIISLSICGADGKDHCNRPSPNSDRVGEQQRTNSRESIQT
jgi:hypothetical protein